MVSTSSSMCLERSPMVRPLAGKSRTNNACVLLGFRSAGVTSHDFGTLLGGNLKILKNIILQDGAEFTKVWTKSSKTAVSYESGRIYFENYRCSYTSLTPQPQLLYEMPKRSKAEKIEDSLLCQCPLDKTLPWALEQKPSLLSLTANNWLYHLSADTGQTLHRVYLSPHFKFRSLGWDVSQETFYVKSIQHKQTPLARQAGVENNVLMHLAIFQVFPLDVIGVLEINKKVFGKSVVDVLLSQGVLAVSHSSKCVKLYSLEYIVKKFRTKKLVLGQECDLYGARGIVGDTPYGIPVNIHIKECPPALFEMSYLDNGIQIGGHPWHYIYTPNHKRHRGTHHICSIIDGALASQVTVTSSGRTVKKRIQQLEDDPDQETFKMVKYEDELDLLAIVDVSHIEDEGQASVRLHNNKSGALLKKIPLQEPWDVTYSHEVYFDRDTIIHIEQERNNNYSCHVYKIKRRTN
ncbi:DDB1- and CUL4-associated factor 17 isoform X2 [Hemibagrus wyckioides]|uniref:DDB1- and CUL4-associated factor 17 isoform X2 n=1 Tax=Hemibagrus wyckioides TaxID=337641 RepID=UPI00266B3F1B|nr:DDB1- and CUL4-associated factor 17 isoform X2 [Hemibagrus wyckioides]